MARLSLQQRLYLTGANQRSPAIAKNPVNLAIMNLLDRITINPDICHGKPTIRGMRYPVESMLELLAGGMTIEEILMDYPDLEADDLLACLQYAAKLTKIKSIYQIAS